jgi:lipoprotein-anchoring transpeptidase ErfK/SrfK
LIAALNHSTGIADQWTYPMGCNMNTIRLVRAAAAIATVVATTTIATMASANPFFLFGKPYETRVERAAPGTDEAIDQPARLRRQIIDYRTTETPGTIIIDTPNTYLYLVIGNGKAMRYGIGVGREGFTWSGTQAITKKAEWPAWTPPAEMLARQPYLPRYMAGGPGNPMGARAMYLGNTIYRIHGTNDPSTIGGRVSSGCIRMTNDDVTDLYSRVNIGTKVVVLPTHERRAAVH